MAEQTGVKIKEARLSAGMTQKELAGAIDGLSVKKISEAERGLRELTNEELVAIAEVTGSKSLLDETGEETPETSVMEANADPKPEAEPEGQNDQSSLSAVVDALGSAVHAATSGESIDVDAVAAAVGDIEGIDADAVAAVVDDIKGIDVDAVATAVGGIKGLNVSAVAGMFGSVASAVKGNAAKK